MIDTTVEEDLINNGETVIQTTGISMEPMLHNRKSTVILKKADGQIKKYDVVLFKRRDELVLHRVVKIEDDAYFIRGDNCVATDEAQRKEIIGVMTGYFPDESEKFISCDDLEYKKYVRTVYFRYLPKRIKYYAGRIFELVLGSNRKV